MSGMNTEYMGYEIQLSESGYSYECPALELSAPTLAELESAIRGTRAYVRREG